MLLVEDEDLVRRLVRAVLEQHGYRVIEASSPGAALELSQRHGGAIDLLLTDVVMPDMGGQELAAELTTARPGLKTLFMSGYSEEAIAKHGVAQAWADSHFIAKPFAPNQLAEKVREALEHA